MKRLLSIELQKLWLNRASRVLIISYFSLLSFIALITTIKFTIFGQEIRLADQGIFNFPFIWHFNTWVAAIFKLFLAIVIVSMMANEYTYGTLKQNLIDGLSKTEFLKTKVLTVTGFAAASTIFIFFLTLILGYCFSPYNELSIVFTDVSYLLAYFVKLVAFFSFCLFAGILVKRSAFSLGFIILWYIGEWLIYWLMRWIIPSQGAIDKIYAFFPMEAMSNLIVEPISRFKTVKAISTMSGSIIDKDFGVHWYSIVIGLIWTVVFIYSSYRILKKRDL